MGHNYRMISMITLLLCTTTILFCNMDSNLHISQYISTPRINLFNDPGSDQYEMGTGEIIHFRTDIEYRKTMWDGMDIHTIVDFGSENYRNDRYFRLRALYGTFQFSKATVKIGRQAIWNPFYQTIMDGVNMDLTTRFINRASIGAGYRSEFIRSDDKRIIYASGTSNNSLGELTLHTWGILMDKNDYFRAGAIYRLMLDHLNITTYLSWDFNRNVPYYNRIHLNRTSGNYRFFAGVRQRIFNIEELYSWIPKENWNTVSAYAGSSIYLNPVSFLNIKFTNRFSESKNWYFLSSFHYKTYSIMMLSGQYQNKFLLGGMITGSFPVNEKLDIGGNISMNSLELDNETELSDAFGLYVWTELKLSPGVRFRIFGQYYENPYYTMDGRGGVYVSYDI